MQQKVGATIWWIHNRVELISFSLKTSDLILLTLKKKRENRVQHWDIGNTEKSNWKKSGTSYLNFHDDYGSIGPSRQQGGRRKGETVL